MKKLLIARIALLSFASMSLTSCIVDWYPVVLSVQVCDKEGNDLLDPTSDKYIADGLTITYRGETYELIPPTKYYMPDFTGLTLSHSKDGYLLYFGEFAGEEDYDDDFILKWKDGSEDVIHYKRRVNVSFISAWEEWRLNGKKCDNPVKIIKQVPGE